MAYLVHPLTFEFSHIKIAKPGIREARAFSPSILGKALAALVVILTLVLITKPGFAQTSDESANETSDQVGRVTGFKIPRFVSLKSGEVNMRHGPGASYQIDWRFMRRGLPMEVVAEYDNWRRVRSHDGTEGWIHYQLLDGRRMALVKSGQATLYRRQNKETAAIAAIADVGVVLRLHKCGPVWCRAEVGGYKGWLTRENLWGLYDGEEFD